MSILGERIKNYRKKQNLTQDQVADLLGIKRSNFSSYETGRTIPPSDKLDQLADILHTTTDFLLGKTDVNLYDWIPRENSHVSEDGNPVDAYNNKITPTQKEQEFLNKVKLDDDTILDKFTLELDGKELTKEEAHSIIAFLRVNRQLHDK
ncbi:putative transcriptional regulator [Bacillus sp. TS-2]|nr:putative transcriptional regulator [Bacillus sp. TS-2]